jgi:hypothetical protein
MPIDTISALLFPVVAIFGLVAGYVAASVAWRVELHRLAIAHEAESHGLRVERDQLQRDLLDAWATAEELARELRNHERTLAELRENGAHA